MTIPDIQIPISGKYIYDEKGVQKQLIGTIDLGQIKTIGKERIVSKKICKLYDEVDDINKKLLNIFGLSDIIRKRDNVIASLMGRCEYYKKTVKIDKID